MAGKDDPYVSVGPALEWVGDFARCLGQEFDEQLIYAALRKVEAVGLPVGSKAWLEAMEARTGTFLIPAKRGHAPKDRAV